MKEVFMPAEIRNLLGISRSAIQYYRDKGLIEIKKTGIMDILIIVEIIFWKLLTFHFIEIV